MRQYFCIPLVVSMLVIAACEDKPAPGDKPAPPAKPTSLILPDDVSSPDGMTLARDGKIYLSMLNLEVDTQPAIWTIDADDKAAKFTDLPNHPETGKVYPLGITQGSDGNFYVADNQTFNDATDHKSRLLRIVVEDGKPVRVETVATGLISVNAVVANQDRIYVTETVLINGSEPLVSGVYMFEISELDAANPVALKPDGADPRLVARFTTTATDWRKDVGANGLTFSPDGRLFVCNFGEASILTAPLKDDGFLAEELKELIKGGGMDSTDGIRYLPDTDQLVVADFFANALHLVDAETGKVTTLASNDNSTGADGQFDKCSEPCVRGNLVYVANIDLPRDGNVPDKPHSLVIVPLPAK